jgi:hypothetical protein
VLALITQTIPVPMSCEVRQLSSGTARAMQGTQPCQEPDALITLNQAQAEIRIIEKQSQV